MVGCTVTLNFALGDQQPKTGELYTSMVSTMADRE